MTFAFTKYWVEGEKEVLQTLFEAITNNEDCYAEDVLLNLGINTDDYDTSRVEWCNAELIQKDHSLTGGSTYEVRNLEGFNRDIWLCPVTLFVLGRYPKYMYVKKVS